MVSVTISCEDFENNELKADLGTLSSLYYAGNTFLKRLLQKSHHKLSQRHQGWSCHLKILLPEERRLDSIS
jgi:hypothetical protein